MNHTFYCHILRSETTGNFYIGHTAELKDRLERQLKGWKSRTAIERLIGTSRL